MLPSSSHLATAPHCFSCNKSQSPGSFLQLPLPTLVPGLRANMMKCGEQRVCLVHALGGAGDNKETKSMYWGGGGEGVYMWVHVLVKGGIVPTWCGGEECPVQWWEGCLCRHTEQQGWRVSMCWGDLWLAVYSPCSCSPQGSEVGQPLYNVSKYPLLCIKQLLKSKRYVYLQVASCYLPSCHGCWVI